MLLYAIDAKESISKGIIEFWALIFAKMPILVKI